MLLRGGKTVEKREFLQDSKFSTFIHCYFVRFRMFVTFTYLFFLVDVDLRSEIRVCELFPGFGSHWTLRDFHEFFGKIAVWTQSATDNPEFVSPSTGHQILHQ